MRTPSSQPTPYADVNAVLGDFLTRIRAILGDQLVGMYLYGSLALGDFDPGGSDIDFIAITRDDIPEDRFAALAEMHAAFAASGSPWADGVEAAYIPMGALREAAPTKAQHPQIERGLALVRAPLEIGWVFQRHSLYAYGVPIAGPDVRDLVEPVDRRDMRQAALAITGGWLEQSRSDPGWRDWARIAGPQAFIVLTLCRLLYSVETGDVASKPAAARWARPVLAALGAQGAQGAQWEALIERSLAGLHREELTSEDSLAETINLIQVIHERFRQTAA